MLDPRPVLPRATEGVSVRCSVAEKLLEDGAAEIRRSRLVRGAAKRTRARIARAVARIALASALLGLPLAHPVAAADPDFRGPMGAFGLPDVGMYDEANPSFADIDGDGDLDAFILGDGEIHFGENTGTPQLPAFAPSVADPFNLTGAGPEWNPSFGDIDGDGDLDCLVRSNFFENTGTSAAPAFAAPLTGPFGPMAGVFVDLDDDSDLDAVLGATFYENTGTPLLPAFAPSVPGAFGLSQASSFADLDGDGDLDAVSGDSDGGTYTSENTGTSSAPAFAPRVVVPNVPDIGHDSAPVLADIDGDGDFDLFVGEGAGQSVFVRNTGAPTVPVFQTLVNPFGLVISDHYSGGNFSAPAFGDLDGDGDLDAQNSEYIGNFFQENTGSATFPAFGPRIDYAFGMDNGGDYQQTSFVDLDGDGDLDLVKGGGYEVLGFQENTGSPTSPAFAPETRGTFGLESYYGSFGFQDFVDIDGDGDLDCFIGLNNDSGIDFLENTGSPTAPAFASGGLNAFGMTQVGEYSIPDFSDLDGDGDFDLLVGTEAGGAFFMRNTGTPTAPAFAAPIENPFGIVSVGQDSRPQAVDIDGDGLLELFFGTRQGISVLFENYTPPPATEPLVLSKALARSAGGNSLVTAKGTLSAGQFDVAAGLTFTFTDGATLNETAVLQAADCETKNNGKIKCVSVDPVSKQKAKAIFAPQKKSPGEYKFKVFTNKRSFGVPLVAPLTVTIDEGTTGGPPFEGASSNCFPATTKLVCKG